MEYQLLLRSTPAPSAPVVAAAAQAPQPTKRKIPFMIDWDNNKPSLTKFTIKASFAFAESFVARVNNGSIKCHLEATGDPLTQYQHSVDTVADAFQTFVLSKKKDRRSSDVELTEANRATRRRSRRLTVSHGLLR